jgi:hypothetical protein
MTTEITSASAPSAQLVNQTAGKAEYQILLERIRNVLEELALEFPARQNQAATNLEEYKRAAHVAFHLENNSLREFKEKEKTLRAKWEEPVVQAVLCAAKLSHGGPDFMDFAKAVKDNSGAWEEAMDIVEAGGEEYDVEFAIGFGMVCGMMYAQLTGMTLMLKEEERAAAPAAEERNNRLVCEEALKEGEVEGLWTIEDGIVKLVKPVPETPEVG